MKNLVLLTLFAVIIIGCSKDDNLSNDSSLTYDSASILKNNGNGNGNSNGNGNGNNNNIEVCLNGAITSVNANAISAFQNQGIAVDSDGDGYFDVDNDCSETDCDDTDATVNPGADEQCDDEIDNNCNGEIDEGCDDCCLSQYLNGNEIVWNMSGLDLIGYQITFSDSDNLIFLLSPGWWCGGYEIVNFTCVIYDSPYSIDCQEALLSIISEAEFNSCLDLLAQSGYSPTVNQEFEFMKTDLREIDVNR